MRILLWAPFGAGTHYWGPGTSAYRLYKANKDKEIKVTLIHATDRQSDFPDVYNDQIALPSLENSNIIGKIKYLIAAKRWIRKNHHKYDVVHGITAYFQMFIPALLFIKYNVPVYLKLTGEHGGFGENSKVSKLTGFKKLREMSANKISGYISISSTITQNLIESGIQSERIYYIPNGVDTNRFVPASLEQKNELRRKLGIKNKFTYCYIGGLTENKRVIETVKATYKLIKDGFEIQFLIVGPDRSQGVIENEINHYIKEHQLQDVCIRIDHTDKPEQYFKASDLFILNSKSEGLSNSLLEAMASGLPCIAYPASGTIDLIDDGVNGYLTDGQNDQIYEKIKNLCKNQSLYTLFAHNARETIEKNFSVDYVMNEHVLLFKKFISENNETK